VSGATFLALTAVGAWCARHVDSIARVATTASPIRYPDPTWYLAFDGGPQFPPFSRPHLHDGYVERGQPVRVERALDAALEDADAGTAVADAEPREAPLEERRLPRPGRGSRVGSGYRADGTTPHAIRAPPPPSGFGVSL
jgi:hypothetical protein